MNQKQTLSLFIEHMGRIFPVRHRYVLTRDNRLRLRYICSFLAISCVSFIAISGFSSGSAALIVEKEEASETILLKVNEKTPQSMVDDTALLPGVIDGEQSPEVAAIVKKSLPKPPSRPAMNYVHAEIGKGDTLDAALRRAGLSAGESYRVAKAMEGHYNPRSLQPGQKIQLQFRPAEDTEDGPIARRLVSFQMPLDALRTLSISHQGDNEYSGNIVERKVNRKLYTGNTTIQVSLYGSGQKSGIPVSVLTNAIHLYSWDVDFQRDIRQGDMLEVMYEYLETPDGEKLKTGDIVYARLNVNGHDIPVYRYKMKNGDTDYFTPSGVSVRKALMKTPIDGARISSGYGLRKHPVLGYSKMHKGVDFAAPSGTPIYAAGDGIVEKASRWSSYGNYIKIRHNSEYKTAYAHLKGFAKNVKAGKRVKQGQVIGYVGTTGRSTGPHLHYEVIRSGVQVNPRKMKLPQGNTLRGTELASFKSHMDKMSKQYAKLNEENTKVASYNQ